MRIIQITPGSGDNFYCENCLRDATLVRAMRCEGHDVILVPLYLPLETRTDEPLTDLPIFYGGINVYLQQKLGLFRKTPRWLDKLLDSQALLEWAGRKVGMTRAKDLGETTISMLKGRDGRQVKELDRLLNWLAAMENRPDVVCLSNALLSGLAPGIRERLKVPVVCLLQDEDGFVDGLTSPYTETTWDLMQQNGRAIDGFIAVSRYYGQIMQQRLAIPDNKLDVVPMGVPVDAYTPASTPPDVPSIGFLSRMCPEKGLDTLVEAFILLKAKESLKHTRLYVAGGRLLCDDPFIAQLKERLQQAGVLDDVTFLPKLSFEDKVAFLQGLSVLTVPEKQPVAYGLYVLEAMACAVPVVEPAFGVFPEIIEQTDGGLLYEGTSADVLADALRPLLQDTNKARALGQSGREGVTQHYDIRQTANRLVSVYKKLITRFG